MRRVRFAQAEGYTVNRIVIPIPHQEADRASSRAQYLVDWRGLKSAAEAALGLPILWLVDQASGTTAIAAGGNRPNRMAIHDATLAANDGANVKMVQPRYPLALGLAVGGGGDIDNIHHSYRARAAGRGDHHRRRLDRHHPVE